MAKNNLVIIIIVAVIAGGLGFFGGMQYQKSQPGIFSRGANQGFPREFNQQRVNGRQGNGMGRPVNGEIINLDENTITIKDRDGSSKIVVYSNSTKISKASEGSVSDLKVGEQVTAFGQEGSDGTVTAQTISIGGGMFQRQPPVTGQPQEK